MRHGGIAVQRLSDEHRQWRDDAGSKRGCGSWGQEAFHLKMGKGASNSIIQPRDVGSANCEVINEGDAANKVYYPGRLGVFQVDDGFD